MTGSVEQQIADLEHLVLGCLHCLRAAEQPTQASDEFLKAEGFGQVVVGTSGQSRHPVHHRVTGGEEQDGGVHLRLTNRLEDRQSVHVGEHDVEDQDVGFEFGEFRHGLLPVVGHLDPPALIVQGHFQKIGQSRLVVDKEHADRRPVGPGDTRKLSENRLALAGRARCNRHRHTISLCNG